MFLFGDVTRPFGLILNNDPLECYVLFPPATSMQEIVKLTENPSWVGTSMRLGLHKPSYGMLAIASRLLQGKDLEKDKEYEYISIQPLDPGVQKIIQPLKRREDLLLLMLCHMSLSTCQHRNFSSY